MNAKVDRGGLARSRVLVVGDAMLDRYWFGAVERISPEAPVPVVRVNTSKEQERLGGAANVAWNVKALGAHPSLLTAIGDDEHGRRLEKLLEKHAIETLFKRDPRLTTIVKLRGGGEEGIGEDVVYDAVDHIGQQTHGPPEGLAGSFSFAEFSDRLDGIDLFPAGEPEREQVSRDYRRWAYERGGSAGRSRSVPRHGPGSAPGRTRRCAGSTMTPSPTTAISSRTWSATPGPSRSCSARIAPSTWAPTIRSGRSARWASAPARTSCSAATRRGF